MKTEFFLKQDHYRVSSLVYSYALISAIFAYGEYCMRDYFFAALLIFHTAFSGVLFSSCANGGYISSRGRSITKPGESAVLPYRRLLA